MRKIVIALMSLLLTFSLMPAPAYAVAEATDQSGAANGQRASAEPAADEEETLLADIRVKGPGLEISWNQPKGARTYEIYRSKKANSGWSLLRKGVTGCSYADNTTKSGVKMYYKLRAARADGSFTDYSNTVSGVVYRVYIETGHGTGDDGVWDPGCTWGKYQEAKLMIPICRSMAKYLRKKGVYVYTDAFNGNNRNLNWTLKKIRKSNVSVLVNVHCDYKKAPRGTMPLYRYSDQKKLAKCLNKGVHKYVKIKDRGIKKRKDLKTLNKTKGKCVACLFETGNIRKDNKILRKQYDAYGKGLAKGVCDYLGIRW